MVGVGFAVALVALFTSLKCKVYADNLIEVGAFYPENGFLAGELTPVWLAYKGAGYRDMVYEKLEDGMVKKAIDYFKSSEFHGLHKKRRNIVDMPPLPPMVAMMDDLGQGPEEFYYPSVLVAMEYDQKWPADKASQDKLIFDKILYALAYWNIIDSQLRQLRYPGVRIRITGFVIARDKDVTPEHLKVQAAGIRIYDTFHQVFPYWYKLQHSNNDFREGTHNVVAFMTNTPRLIGTMYGTSRDSPNCDNKYYKGLSGLMVWDDFNFYGISQTLGEMAHIMGRSNTGTGAYIEDGGFTADDFKTIKYHLVNNATCWKQPNEVYPPGPPADEILREDLLPH